MIFEEIGSLFVPGLEESTRVEQILDVLCLGRDGSGFDGPQERLIAAHQTHHESANILSEMSRMTHIPT